MQKIFPHLALSILFITCLAFVVLQTRIAGGDDPLMGASITSLQNTMTGSTSMAVINANFAALNTDKLEHSDLSGGTGITYNDGTISFDCSEVEGTGINCAGEAITLDATGDWTGTFDGQDGSYYATTTHTHSQYASASSLSSYLGLSAWYATTTHALISSLPSLSITESQISDLGSYLAQSGYYGTTTLPALTATTTGANGVNISAGCFAIGGTCIGGSGAGTVNAGTAGQVAYYLADGTAVSGTSTMTIAGDGTLTVQKAGTGGIYTRFISTTLENQDLNLWPDGTGGVIINDSGFNNGLEVDNSGIVFYANSGNIRFNDNVGIGTSTPAYPLDVYGNARIDGNTTFNGRYLYFTGSPDVELLAYNDFILSSLGTMTLSAETGIDVNSSIDVDGNITADNLDITGWNAKWTFASTTLDYWFDNTTGITRLNSYMTQAYASSTFYTKLEINAFGYISQAYASSSFAAIGGAFHDGFSDFVANEHIDWTGASAGTIHSTNYVDNNTNASTICAGTTTYLDGEGNCDDISSVYLGQSTFYATTSINHITDLPALNTYPAFSIASTTWMGIARLTASSTIQLKPAYTAETWAGFRCATDTGTALIKIGDGTNYMTAITASSTAGLIAVSSNNTFTAGEVQKAVVSNISATTNWISCSVSKKNE